MQFNSITIDLIRHGEPEGGEKFRGSLDDPLSALGWSQMEKTIGDHQYWERIISSPLSRCKAFAEKTSEVTKTPLTIESNFREISFGDWEGKKAAEISSEALALFWSNPSKHPAPNGERLADFQGRVITAWEELLDNTFSTASPEHQDKKILVVAHGGTIRIILAHILHMPLSTLFNLQIPFAAISRAVIYKNDVRDAQDRLTSCVAFVNGCLNKD